MARRKTNRLRMNAFQQSIDSGFELEEILTGLWPTVQPFLIRHHEWKLKQRFTNNNGLTILERVQ